MLATELWTSLLFRTRRQKKKFDSTKKGKFYSSELKICFHLFFRFFDAIFNTSKLILNLVTDSDKLMQPGVSI